MNGPLVDAAKKILKREYGVECTEPFAGVDRFRRTTGNTVAQVDLEGMKGGSVYKLRLCGFCYDNDEKYEEEKQIKPTESANPKGLAEIIDEYLSKVETNLHILIKTHRPYSKKKRILNIGEAKEILKNAGIRIVEASQYDYEYELLKKYFPDAKDIDIHRNRIIKSNSVYMGLYGWECEFHLNGRRHWFTFGRSGFGFEPSLKAYIKKFCKLDSFEDYQEIKKEYPDATLEDIREISKMR